MSKKVSIVFALLVIIVPQAGLPIVWRNNIVSIIGLLYVVFLLGPWLYGTVNLRVVKKKTVKRDRVERGGENEESDEASMPLEK